jgi:hypothetical protein
MKQHNKVVPAIQAQGRVAVREVVPARARARAMQELEQEAQRAPEVPAGPEVGLAVVRAARESDAQHKLNWASHVSELRKRVEVIQL